jgi:maltose O-acetyltransferase
LFDSIVSHIYFQMATDTRTEKEKMLVGDLYNAFTPQLLQERSRCKEMVYDFNLTRPSEGKKRDDILRKLFGSFGSNSVIETPLQCDYGSNVYWGKNSFANHNLVILDTCAIHVGDFVLMGPDVKLYSATHPIDPQMRLEGAEYGKPIRIGNNVWIGGGVVVVAGVTIGDNSVIGAGSVVVKDIPANVVAVGNPCRVIKQLDAPTRPPKEFQQLTQFS